MNELNELIANATDAQLAHLALFFADWMQTPDADDAVSRAALRIVQEIRFRAVEDRQQAVAA
tara:strand:+ start:1184 stop:1369 length:186 start_codon:yes stop_codon:yes gene_type:complete